MPRPTTPKSLAIPGEQPPEGLEHTEELLERFWSAQAEVRVAETRPEERQAAPRTPSARSIDAVLAIALPWARGWVSEKSATRATTASVSEMVGNLERTLRGEGFAHLISEPRLSRQGSV